MRVAILRETFPDENRVALIPASVPVLAKAGFEVHVESGCGTRAGFLDADYRQKGATVVEDRSALLACPVVVQVRALGASGATDPERQWDSSQIRVASCDPWGEPQAIAQFAPCGATLFALELIPRITRAQNMDILSSMATIAGYRAVLLGALELNKMFPMLMTAAGTLAAARVFVIGAGVAGLQAIATARRLGAIVQAYDVRPACREQVESLGAKFVELELETGTSEDQGGYAKALGDEFYQRQRELMANIVAESDVVITTAAIPGKTSPLLITKDAVEGMQPGAVIVDLAAERGGNCELAQPNQRVLHQGVVILGPTNLPSEVPYHASQMFSNNVTRFLINLLEDGQVDIQRNDEIVQQTMATCKGEVVHSRLREILGLQPLTGTEPQDHSPAEVDSKS